MGTVTTLRPTPESVTIGQAVKSWVVELRTKPIDPNGERYASANTIRAYRTTVEAALSQWMTTAELGTDTGALRLRTAFAERWGNAKPATRNAKRAALIKFIGYLHASGLLPEDFDPMAGIEPAGKVRPEIRTRPREQVDELIENDKANGLRERALWALLYESFARADEVLSLNVEDLDLRNRSARIIEKGGDQAVIMWDTTAAGLLAKLVRGRTSGPVFVTERRGKGESTGEIEREHLGSDGHKRLSYARALELFKAATGGWTLHDLRHSGISHALEDGVPMPVVMAKSRHRDLASFRRYANPSIAYAQRQVEEARRRSRNGGGR